MYDGIIEAILMAKSINGTCITCTIVPGLAELFYIL